MDTNNPLFGFCVKERGDKASIDDKHARDSHITVSHTTAYVDRYNSVCLRLIHNVKPEICHLFGKCSAKVLVPGCG